MKKVQIQKYKEAIENAEEYIEKMSRWDDKRLEKHLLLFQRQMQMAYELQNHEAFTLLQEYEWQVLTARLKRMC